MVEKLPVSSEHRERRRGAHERAAEAHEHSAEFHDEAAEFFNEHDRPGKADNERAHAEIDRDEAQRERYTADRDPYVGVTTRREAVTVTPEELRLRAAHAIAQLGAPPDSAREQVQWRERRDSAAVHLAADAEGNTALLSKASALCEGLDDEPARQLLDEARGYCPR